MGSRDQFTSSKNDTLCLDSQGDAKAFKEKNITVFDSKLTNESKLDTCKMLCQELRLMCFSPFNGNKMRTG